MKKEFDLSIIRPKIGFNINPITLIPINKIKLYDYEFDFDVYLESKKCNLQRPLVWTLEQKQEFVLSILKGIPIPSLAIVLHQRNDKDKGVYKIIDGKQRLNAIISFYNNEFPIPCDDEIYYYNDLPKDVQFMIGNWHPNAQIAYSYWDDNISDDNLIKWFNLINFAGTEQELSHKNKLNSLLNK